eukprot:9513225-Heterocapsa_arctica.AAC.1
MADFTIAELIAPVKKPTAADVRSDSDRGWLSWAQAIEYDQDYAFQTECEQIIVDPGLPRIPVAPEAHWRAGKVERKMGFLNEMSQQIAFDDQQEVIGHDA